MSAEATTGRVGRSLPERAAVIAVIDSNSDSIIGGAEGATFLRRSGLTTEQLREVWRLASGGVSKPQLDKNDWLVACKVVAAVQGKGGEPNLLAVVGPQADVGFADFGYGHEPAVDAELPVDIPSAAVKVRVDARSPRPPAPSCRPPAHPRCR